VALSLYLRPSKQVTAEVAPTKSTGTPASPITPVESWSTSHDLPESPVDAQLRVTGVRLAAAHALRLSEATTERAAAGVVALAGNEHGAVALLENQ
jgi:hypothetical protein